MPTKLKSKWTTKAYPKHMIFLDDLEQLNAKAQRQAIRLVLGSKPRSSS